MTLNSQSIKGKMDEFRGLVKVRKPHIIGVTESWGQPDIGDEVFMLDNYTMYRRDRVGKIGGGTLLYIHKKLGHRDCKQLNSLGNREHYDSSAWCWVIPKQGKKVLVGCIYRSTSSQLGNNLNLMSLLNKANDVAGKNRLLIMGDFNVPKVDWMNNEILPGAKMVERDFYNCVTDNLLHQHVKEFTRFKKNEKSTLDLIFTKEEEDVKNINVIQPLGKSDHGVVLGDFICKWKSRVEPKKRRAYYKGDYNSMKDELNQIDWVEEFTGKNVQECWDKFKAIVMSLTEKYVPLVDPKDYNEPWMNRKVMKLWHRKRHAFNRVKENNTDRRWEEYKKERNRLRKNIRKARRNYERKIAKKARTNKRAFFKYVNSRLTVRPEITAMKNENGQLMEDDREIVEIMGKYFNDVWSSYDGEEMPNMQMISESQIRSIVISIEVVQSRLEKLNVHKSCGPDELHPYVLQGTAKELSLPLTIIFQKSLDEGRCPDDWKSANVTPIHKKGDRTEPSNYRPVSLTSQVCKVLESIVREQVIKHLNSNNLLSEVQHGFREGRSCLTNLLETLEIWTEIIDEGDGLDIAYLDFRKAFDLVSHKHLIFKMSRYGINGQILNWVEDFLRDRSQRVVIRGTASTPLRVTSGVPQGSVLGPILFLIFINDLPLNVISPLSLFADDSKIFSRIVTNEKRLKSSIESGTETLQRDLENVVEWAKKWKMEFNVDKCKIMHLGRRNPKNVYQMDGKTLNETAEEKDLGVLIDNELDFGKHIKGIVGKANKILGMIRISFACLNKRMFLNLYLALVRPLLEYCVQVWSPYKRKYINLVEGVQRRATKLVPELRNLPYEERLRRLKLTTLEERRVRGDMIETYKIITGKEQVDHEKFFKIIPDRRGRHTKKIYRKRSRLNVRRNFFSQRVGPIWNNLSREEVEAKKTSKFKEVHDIKEIGRRRHREGDIFVWYRGHWGRRRFA